MLALVLLQLPTSLPGAQPTLPVLDFPEPGLDDKASYQGYQTRFYRDSKQNTVQIYLEPRGGRVVALWADAANASVGFTVRGAQGRPPPLRWGAEAAEVADSEAVRTLEYWLEADASAIDIGGFLLGSMRVERDLQYAHRHLLPFGAAPFRVAEESLLVANVAGLPVEERGRHLELLRAAGIAELRSRLQPTIVRSGSDTGWTVRVERPSLDGRNRLGLELAGMPSETTARVAGRTVSVQSRSGAPIRLRVRVATDAAALTPLGRGEIFNPAFLAFLAAARAETDSAGVARYRRLERQVRAVELLSSEEKLMAGLPSFATYFGRDMMMTALMMQPIWAAEMSEHVIASVLRKLGPAGQVSHEEALGGQAIRENAQRYDSLLTAYFPAARTSRAQQADSLLALARDLLRELQATRENYHMIDDEFQLPVLVARYLADPDLPATRKRAFLYDASDARGPRLALLLREMALVARQTRPYVEDPRVANLVGFPRRTPQHWRSASWRDSDAGYAGGRFAMDVNAIWAPQALEAIATILATLPTIGVGVAVLDSIAPELRDSPLGKYSRDSTALRQAIEIWRKARRHFAVALGRDRIRERVQARLGWLPRDERSYWQKLVSSSGGLPDSLRFLALSLDSAGTPIPVVNSDAATGLLLESQTDRILSGATRADAELQDLEPFGTAYPVGLFVDGLGPLVANDAYASPELWARFRKDHYHGPRVVWGREVNLLFIGLANQIAAAYEAGGRLKDPSLERYVRTLDSALRRTLVAVRASGLEHNELWSYRIEGGRLLPVRYGTSSDVQLWNTTDLAVEFVLSRLPPAEGPHHMIIPEAREAGWRLLFDGKTTAGWRGYRTDAMPAGWQAIGGALTRVAPAGDIVTIDRYGNFELALEWQVAKGGNSGIFYRVSEDLEYPWQSGLEMQVLDDRAHPDGRSPLTSAGALYGIYPARPGVVRPAGEWNAVRLVVNGNHIEHWLNGVRIVEAELGSPDWQARVNASRFGTMPRYGRNHSGHIGLQDHGDRVSYRNIQIRVLP
ncbi:MAG: 3-keto-disaccharide hydrolase [Gemmatimonadales bacterium]